MFSKILQDIMVLHLTQGLEGSFAVIMGYLKSMAFHYAGSFHMLSDLVLLG